MDPDLIALGLGWPWMILEAMGKEVTCISPSLGIGILSYRGLIDARSILSKSPWILSDIVVDCEASRCGDYQSI